MSELNDFLKLIAEGKKTDPVAVRTKEIKENIKSDLGGLFSQMAEMKKVDPVYQKNKKLEEQVHEGIKADLGSLFAELASLKNKKEEILEENPELVDTPIEGTAEQLAEEILTEVSPLNTPIGDIPVTQQLEPQNNPIVNIDSVTKYLSASDQAKEQEKSTNNSQYDIDLINKKIKFIEQWVGKIQNTGPGSGEVNLRYLDDVDRSTIGDGKYLNYNATTKKFQFSTLSGGGAPQVQSDWTEADNTEPSFIKNKPTLFSGSYNDLTDTPSIPEAQVNSDWNATTGVAEILNKPTIPDAQIQSDWNQTVDTELDYINNKPTALSEFDNDISYISWTNPSPTPSDNFKTIIAAADGVATITLLDGLPGVGSSDVWSFDADKVTFPDNTEQTTAAVPQIQSDWNQTVDTELDYIKNKPTIPDITNIEEALAITGEPMGHEDRAQSTMSFDATSRTFTITPVSSSFDVWVKGIKYTYTTAQSVTIPNTSGIYYIYFDSNGLGYQTDYFIWDDQAPTSLVYYNSATGLAPYFADERHGTTLDWQTHEYLHRTRGAVIANGFSISNYTIGGNVQVDIANGTFFDEDLEIDVTHSNTPTANTWEQDLQGPAQIPMFYLSGTGWVRDNPTGYLNKQGTSRPRYNSLSGGVWSVADIDNNKYGTTFIVATNNLTYPIIAIMSQSSHANQGDAEALEFSDLVLTGFPVAEFRLLYKVVFKADSTHGTLTSVWDLRQLSSVSSSAAVGSDHGLLSGLGDDDHPQYLLRTEAPTALSELTNDANYIKSNELVNLTYTGTGSSSTLTVGGYNSKGGTGYHDFLKVTNGYGSATNTNKWFRLNSTGGLEVVNSDYTATIFSLSDTGVVNTGEYQVNGKKAVNGPSFSAYPTSPAQSIPAASNVRVNFGNEEYDIGGCYDAPNGKFLPNVEGYYQLNATVRIDGSSGTGERMIVIYKNGSEYKRGTNEAGSEAAATFFTMSVSCQAYANGSTDYFQVYVVQNSGANRPVSEYQQISYFQGCMIRGA